MYVYLHMFYTFYYHIQDLFKTKIKHISFTYTTYSSCKYLSNLIVLKIVFSANFEFGNVILEISLLFIINRPAGEVFDSSSDGQGEEDGDEGKDGCRAGHQPRVRILSGGWCSRSCGFTIVINNGSTGISGISGISGTLLRFVFILFLLRQSCSISKNVHFDSLCYFAEIRLPIFICFCSVHCIINCCRKAGSDILALTVFLQGVETVHQFVKKVADFSLPEIFPVIIVSS